MKTNTITFSDPFSDQETTPVFRNRNQADRRTKRTQPFYDDRIPYQGIRTPRGWNADYPNTERLVADL